MFKFICDEAGAKTHKDKEHQFGLVSGFILTDNYKEKKLIEKIKEIIKKYNLKELKKLHISAINDKSKRESIQIEVLNVLNSLDIIWTYGCVKIEEHDWVNKKNRKKFGIPTLYEECLLRAFMNTIDYYKMYCEEDKIEIISDNIDREIRESFSYLLEKVINPKPKQEYLINDGYDYENKKPKLKAKIVAENNLQPIVLPKYTFKSENSYLTFIADILIYQTFQVLKNKIFEEQVNSHKIMENHICKYLFMYLN